MTEQIGGPRKPQAAYKSNGPIDDRSDPVYHDTSGEKAEKAIMGRHARWQAKQTGDVHHCEHGHYVGYNRALANRCPRCPEGKAANGSAG